MNHFQIKLDIMMLDGEISVEAFRFLEESINKLAAKELRALMGSYRITSITPWDN